MGQGIRPSQFITTYGPGAIMEGTDGPRIICSLEQSRIFDGGPDRDVQRFEIAEGRLSLGLLQGARITRLPSNAELRVPGVTSVYNTYPFPVWSLCATHGVIYQGRRSCPQCPVGRPANHARREAIRFIMACPAGHMDEVNWNGLIPHRCTPSTLLWVGGGASLRNIQIECPDCHARRNFGDAYRVEYPCSGRFPEEGRARPRGCQSRAKIMHRGAANLRMAVTESALTIPPRTTRLHRLLEGDVIYPLITANEIRTKRDLMPLLQRLVDRIQLPHPMFDEINRHSDALVAQALIDVLAIPSNVPPEQIRAEELTALQHAAAHGAPPRAAATPGSAEAFSVYEEDVRRIPRGRLNFRVTPVNRLRVVMVQTGYRRIDETGSIVPVHYPKLQSRWLPGVELLGEGLFIDLVNADGIPVPPPLAGPDVEAWRRGITQNLPQRRPAYVWWHTISHRLITAISIDSGYSAAAIRERVYASTSPGADSVGGILLYTAQPGGDGTFGGMLALAERFREILQDALEHLPRCSNDPLCLEHKFDPSQANGAACYACEFVSETSCECRNMFLDRSVLLNNLP